MARAVNDRSGSAPALPTLPATGRLPGVEQKEIVVSRSADDPAPMSAVGYKAVMTC